MNPDDITNFAEMFGNRGRPIGDSFRYTYGFEETSLDKKALQMLWDRINDFSGRIEIVSDLPILDLSDIYKEVSNG